MALAQGRVGAALWYHTPVVITLALAAIYLFSQTAWRLRGKRGWVLRYDRRWPMVLVGLVPGQLRGPERPVAGPRRPAVKRI